MKEYLEAILIPILTQPEALTVLETTDDQGRLLSVNVARPDMGSVIGKEGQTINSVRVLLHVAGARKDERVSVKVNEPK